MIRKYFFQEAESVIYTVISVVKHIKLKQCDWEKTIISKYVITQIVPGNYANELLSTKQTDLYAIPQNGIPVLTPNEKL